MTKPAVSVVCITYNQEKFIKDALDGFIMQKTNFPFEVIISDDKSTDDTPKIIAEYAKKYPEIIKPLLRDKNLGVSENFLSTIDKAQGKYIALCEGDDYWVDANKLQRQYDFLEKHNEFVAVQTDVDIVYEKTGRLIRAAFKTKHIVRSRSFEEHLINKAYSATPTLFMRESAVRKIIKSWPEFNVTDASFVLMLELFRMGVHYIDRVTAVYRINDDGVSQVFGAKHYERHKGLLAIQDFFVSKYKVPKTVEDKAIEGTVKELMFIQIENGKLDEELFRRYGKFMRSIILAQDSELADKDKQIIDKDRRNAEKDEQIAEKNKQILRRDKLIADIANSKSYKIGKIITAPVRCVLARRLSIKGR
jgi:glucosyltransferase